MESEVGYYRHPTIHGDSIIFVCEDDLWRVSASGGMARRLTANPGVASMPRFSPDGSRVAFVGRDDGPAEVYVMDAEGGAPRRLTWLGGLIQVAGWSPDGTSVIFASDWRQPFMKAVQLFRVPVDGGPPTPLGLGLANAIAHQPDGPGVVLGRNSGDPARWKRYRGGTAGALWVDRAGAGNFKPLLQLPGNLVSPAWIGARIYFLSDHEGYGNLYSSTPTGRGLRRHTSHEEYYLRFPATDGRRIVYQMGADLCLFDPADASDRRLGVQVGSSRPQRNRRYVSAPEYLEDFDLHPEGHSIVTMHRGGAYTMALWEGAVGRHGAASGVRYRLARWLPDGKRLVAVTDESGEEELILFWADGSRPSRTIRGDFGRPIELAVGPAGAEWLALTNQRQEVMMVDLVSGRSSTVERSEYGRVDGLAWSPDGRWLAYGIPISRRTSSIHLCEVARGKIHPLTRGDFRDVRPSFDPAGRYLYFLSWRVLDPVYDSLYFDLGFPKGARPYLVTLQRDLVSPFDAATRPPRPPAAVNGADAGRRSSGKERDAGEGSVPPAVTIDLDGIEDRVVAFPVPESRFGRVLGAPGRALFISYPIEGSLKSSWSDNEDLSKGVLGVYDFETNQTFPLARGVGDFQLSMKGQVVAIRTGNRLRVQSARLKKEMPPKSDRPGRETGWVNLHRVRLAVAPGDEWRQMFREAWRLQRDQFWNPEMSGHDWEGVHDRYLPLLERVASRSEFSDLMWEMQGELGTSHCYELGGDYLPSPHWKQGFLGADFQLGEDSGTWRVARIPRGDSWDEQQRSPLAAPGLNIRPGDEILAIDGEPLDRDTPPDSRLVNLAGRDVTLTIRARAAREGRSQRPARRRRGGDRRTVTVTALGSELKLRYRDWVESNRAQVHRDTSGRIGYVHVPNMGPIGYAEFHRYYGSEVDHDGLIVDVRFNGGGHVSQLLLEKLLRRRVGYNQNRWSLPRSYPMDAPAGPLVALINEYTGSDGDIFSHCFKLYQLGPLIGTRTWGGVVGMWPRHTLVDGTMTTQPEFASWFDDVGWGVENHGTEPDIEVEIRPQDYAAGRDPQLERGVVEALRSLRRRPPHQPQFGRRPLLRPVPLSPIEPAE